VAARRPRYKIETSHDLELVDDFIARKASALERVYARYGDVLYVAAARVLRVRADAEDCVHDALLRVWQRPDSFRRERGSLRAFLVVCVRNEALSRMRAAARRFELAGTMRDEPAEIEIADHVELARLRNAVKTLPAEQRQALELAFFRNKTHVQIAQELGLPLGTVKSRLSLAIRKLHAGLAIGGAR
jgi:RNA polymerase sigma-70 factor (ECF subfamily)